MPFPLEQDLMQSKRFLMPISTLGQCALISLNNQPQNHQIAFKRIGNYATDMHFHHISIPVHLTKITKTPVKAAEAITKFIKNVYQQSFNSLRYEQWVEVPKDKHQAHLEATWIKESSD
jgi:hypothetical protein